MKSKLSYRILAYGPPVGGLVMFIFFFGMIATPLVKYTEWFDPTFFLAASYICVLVAPASFAIANRREMRYGLTTALGITLWYVMISAVWAVYVFSNCDSTAVGAPACSLLQSRAKGDMWSIALILYTVSLASIWYGFGATSFKRKTLLLIMGLATVVVAFFA